MPAQTEVVNGRKDEEGRLSQPPAGSGYCQVNTLSVHAEKPADTYR